MTTIESFDIDKLMSDRCSIMSELEFMSMKLEYYRMKYGELSDEENLEIHIRCYE